MDPLTLSVVDQDVCAEDEAVLGARVDLGLLVLVVVEVVLPLLEE